MGQDDLLRILIMHADRYPRMEPQDVVKLCFQREFGGGHLIRDPAGSLQFLLREMEQTAAGYPGFLTEETGNGYARIYLGMAKAEGISAKTINEVFIRSAAEQSGTVESFLAALDMALKMAEEGAFSFTAEEMKRYLEFYERQGYPVVSHSEGYRNAYHPAYRIIKLDLWNRLLKT